MSGFSREKNKDRPIRGGPLPYRGEVTDQRSMPQAVEALMRQRSFITAS